MADISIIIPVYNGETTISETIDSVLQQSYLNFEVIIVNDGSTDDTISILEEYSSQDNRIKIINQKNGGVSNARNNGIKNSVGTYICFLDADDLYDKDYLNLMYKKINNENMDVCYCGVNRYPIKNKYQYLNKFTNENVLLNYIKGRLPVHTSTWMMKNDLLKKYNILFSEGMSWGEDLEFFYNVLSHTNKIIFVPKYLSYYRSNHSENQLSAFSLDKIDKDYEFIKRVVDNDCINNNMEIEKALLNYRLPALIGNKLDTAIESNYNREELTKYYNKYKLYLDKYNWDNGIRSVKLNITKYKLKKVLGDY